MSPTFPTAAPWFEVEKDEESVTECDIDHAWPNLSWEICFFSHDFYLWSFHLVVDKMILSSKGAFWREEREIGWNLTSLFWVDFWCTQVAVTKCPAPYLFLYLLSFFLLRSLFRLSFCFLFPADIPFDLPTVVDGPVRFCLTFSSYARSLFFNSWNRIHRATLFFFLLSKPYSLLLPIMPFKLFSPSSLSIALDCMMCFNVLYHFTSPR